MIVTAVASTGLIQNPLGQTGYAIESTGYQMHPFESDVTEMDELAEAAGRQCYESWLRPNPATADNKGYLFNIIKQAHFSIFEHATMTFLVDGIGRDTLIELERHRHISWSVVSTRYVDMYLRGMTLPAVFDDIDPVVGQQLADNFMAEWQRCHVVYKDTYDTLITEGIGRKQAREAARKILPQSTFTTFFVTGNVRTLREIYQKRSDPHADREVQEFAEKMMAELQRYAPNSVQDLVAQEEQQ